MFKNSIVIYLLIFIVSDNAISQSGWISETNGTRNYVKINFKNENSGYLIGSDGTIFKSSNIGLSWDLISTHNFQQPLINGSVYNDSMYMVLSGNVINGGGVLSTTNSGLDWTIGEILPSGNGFIALKGLYVLNINTAYVCGFDIGTLDLPYLNGIIYKTTNFGTNWFQSFRGDVEFYDIVFNGNNGAAKGTGFLRTSNAGSSWQYSGGLPSYYGKMSNPFIDTIFMTDTRGRVIGSTNGGSSFFDIPTNNTKPLRDLFFFDSKRGYVIGDTGLILFTTNSGVNWTTQNSGTTKNLRSIYFLNKDTGFVVGDSGIILKTITAGILTNFSNISSEIPDNFSLSQNFPNPFNPNTNINYDLRITSYVSLKVYDVLGNEIATLVNEKQNAGRYNYQFSTVNYQMASGIYFYTLTTGDFKETKRMLLIK